MKVFISVFPLLLFFLNSNVESENSINAVIQYPTTSELEKDWNNEFQGYWINEDEQTRAITKCKIRLGDNHYVVEIWTNCSPEDCYWGELNSGEINGDEKEIEVYLENDFSKRDITLQIIKEKLKIVTQVQYNDGRQARTSTDYLIKQ